jgi:hypothetical protein
MEDTETTPIEPIQVPLADIEKVLANLRATVGNLIQENAVLHAQLMQVLTPATSSTEEIA